MNVQQLMQKLAKIPANYEVLVADVAPGESVGGFEDRRIFIEIADELSLDADRKMVYILTDA